MESKLIMFSKYQLLTKEVKKMAISRKDNWSKLFSSTALIIFFMIFIFLTAQSVSAQQSIIEVINPYRNVNWGETSYLKANLQTHTTESDGDHSPQEVIESYADSDYDILSVTDHNRASWPWRDFLSSDQNNQLTNQLTAVKGVEISDTHHYGSYFNDYTGGTLSLDESLTEVEQRNGLSVFFHPGLQPLIPFLNDH